MPSKMKTPGNEPSIPVADNESPKPHFPIVGIGASAGGLAAFEAFFSGMPADVDPGMAFVLVQHLAPDHKSILTDLIQRYTRMRVYEVTDGMQVQPNCAYIIPPNCDMAFMNGALQLLEPTAPRGQRLPIDFFFRTLAQDQHERAICIVLSGTGSDGTLGLRAIKGEGGMVMVQNPESTEYDGMPHSALSTGMVDFVLPPAEMAAQLMAYVTHAFGKLAHSETTPPEKTENALKKIYILLRNQTSHDFSQYKPKTIQRRIERRMAVNQIDSLDGYIKFLQRTSAEVDALFRDLLIGVTNFFRDPEAFQVIETQVIPKLFAGKPASAVIRIWSPGCSTGEEAYSLAILLAERQEAMKQSFKVQVFATDIDSLAIATARTGLYPASIAADVSPERLSRFFEAEPDGNAYRIHKGIRDMLIFSEQNIIKDPPFSKLDLISCRNLLIYLGADLQKKLMPLFHYALNPGGFLFLGTSETVGEFTDIFTVLDRKAKVYQRKEDYSGTQHISIGRFLLPTTAIQTALPQTGRPGSSLDLKTSSRFGPRELTEQALLQELIQFAALVNAQGDIVYLHGRSGMYLELPPGEPGITNVLKSAREGLKRELTTTLHKAINSKEIQRLNGLRVKTNGSFTMVNLTIRPLQTIQTITLETQLYLIILEVAQDQSQINPYQFPDAASTAITKEQNQNIGSAEAGSSAVSIDERILALQKEISAKDEYLQTANEELETSNEELKSSNEEMQSVNEELQSTNEELETSKEELQSVNEELSTVNNELQTKVSDLSRANSDMNSLLAGTGIATVFVDHHLRILRYTPSITRIIHLILSDVGRPVGHILSNLVGYDSLIPDVQVVLDTLVSKNVEVQTNDGKWFTLRIQPYRTLENVIEGAVITFIDITQMKQTQAALQDAEWKFRALFEKGPIGVAYHQMIYDSTGKPIDYRFLDANGSCQEIFGLDPRGKTAKHIFPDIENELFNWIGTFGHVAQTGEQIRFEQEFMHTGRWVDCVAYQYKPDHFVAAYVNITERKLVEAELHKANGLLRLAVVVRDSQDAITVENLDGQIIAWNAGAVRLYGWSEAEALTMNVRERIPAELRESALAMVIQLSRAEVLTPYSTQRITKDGRVLEVTLTSTALVNETGQIYAVATTERLKPSTPTSTGALSARRI